MRVLHEQVRELRKLYELWAPKMTKTHACPACRHAVSAPHFLKGRPYKCPMCNTQMHDLRGGEHKATPHETPHPAMHAAVHHQPAGAQR